MKKLPIISVFTLVLVLLYFVFVKGDIKNTTQDLSKDISVNEKTDNEETEADMPNPASTYCEDKGGTLETVTNKDGAQFNMCKFEDYSCEEWVYYKGECDVEGDALKVKNALAAKGLNLTGMKVVIKKHLGRDILGSVIPVDFLGGGGYVFATKDASGDIKIVADGNGIISCEMLKNYSDFSTYLIPECVADNGDVVVR